MSLTGLAQEDQVAHHSTTPDWNLFSIVQAVYRQGPPLWEIEEWVKRKAAEFTQSAHVRLPGAAKSFYKKTIDAAYTERDARWAADPDEYKLHLLPAVDVMADLIDNLVNSEELPAGWDRDETIALIKGGLHLADTKLTKRQREAFHLESLIGVNRRTAARAMNVGLKCAGAHLSLAWSTLPQHRANVERLGWYVMSIGGNYPTRPVKNSDKEVSQNVQMPVPAGAVEENESV
ncbi:hypothetical protein ABT272_36665 [Streptomyces sp900105245]|uniref:Uncharacterized protein n=1 Tax=Streptomyces sp. 900105245 TaxID=3154379 RepID=A0ABV1UJ67_9ACTN